MKKSAIKITWLIGMIFLISLVQLTAAGESNKTDFNPDESYVCRVGESLVLDLPEATEYKLDTGNNPNWKIIKELNFIWLIPNKPDNVLILTVTNYNGDKIVTHITSKSKEELPENPIKRIVIKQFPHKNVTQYATEIVTVNTNTDTAPTPTKDQQTLMAEKHLKDEEQQKWQSDEKAKQQEKDQLAIKDKMQEDEKIILKETIKSDGNVTEAVKTEKPVEDKELAQQKVDDKKTDKKETEDSIDRKKINFLVDISGGSYNINKENKASFTGEIVAANKINAGIITQFALSANVNSFTKKYGQSIGIGIEKDQARIGYFAFFDSLLLKTEQYKMTFHYQLRPAIRFKSSRLIVSGFAAIALSKAQYTGIDDPEDPNQGVFNAALNHYGVNIEGILIPRKLYFQFEGAFAESKAYRLLLGIEYGITKQLGIYLKGIQTSYGDQPLLTNELYGNDFSIQAGLKFESNRAELNKRDQIIFPRDYPLVANIKKDNNKNIEDKLTIVLKANPKSGKSPLSVEFTAILSGGKSPYILNWTYGNQSQENINNVTYYTYTKEGTYNAYVTVKDSSNQTAISNTETITVSVGEATSHTILASAGPGGSINPSGSIVVADGGSQSFHISASSGYKISNVKIDGNSETAAAGLTTYDYTFSNVTYNRTISAQFESQSATSHTILASAGPGGSINPSGTVTVTHGGNQSFQINANTGYKINKLKVDGNDISAAEGLTTYDYHFTNVIVNHEIAATFSVIQTNYTVTVTSGANGSITPGTSTYSAGSNPSFNIQPSTGFKIAQILLDGSNYSISNELGQSVEINNIQANHTLSATFSTRTFTVTITNDDPSAGWTNPTQGTYTVNYGSNFTIQSVPNSGYAYKDALIDGVLSNLDEYFTFSNITANHTYYVRWRYSTGYSINTLRSLSYFNHHSPGCSSVINENESMGVGEGESITLSWPSEISYYFPDCGVTVTTVLKSVGIDGEPKGTVTSWTFLNVNSNHSITLSYQYSTL